MRPHRLLFRYAGGLTTAYLFTLAEVVAIVLALVGPSAITTGSVIALSLVGALGTSTVAGGAVALIRPSLRWLAAGATPTPRQVRAAANMMRWQSVITVAPWLITSAVIGPLTFDSSIEAFVVIISALLFGAIATVSTGFLLTLRTLRPLLAAVPVDVKRPHAPGVRARLLLMWVVCTALPGCAIALLVVMRNNNWLLDQNTSIELALLVLAMVAVVLGFRATMVLSISISDPLEEVVNAMAAVEKGQIDQSIDVYEWSEIGQLQSGFNRMVAGLRERDRLRELFGRHVGEEVARRAVTADSSLSGDERDVAVLFIDLVGFTRLTIDHEPHEVAEWLNDFFRIVVAEVDARHGLVNKFQGDAALAVFGAPLRIADPPSAALATARTLANELRSLPVDFGIGVSAGPVFAGNIGAENRYEYTVVGDAVNEAARLADRAKDFGGRALCSGAAFGLAEEAERAQWKPEGWEMLRGRSVVTALFVPTGCGSAEAHPIP
ncbi:adenylate/guanylate cyclase domain-containing protein [Mycobacterium sp. Y57]|uniref:adenylate/guanylate cyclase domain-containing protein n=1 Tax=Mycolicibacterium xanthum TaxID=2796469 RepID=UPI001C84614E|nr:adenylate/guanylate cyclase domain-containing protein [Mycolicibacterium xanthum]MBX7433347.1 adenylate/guanylate cyclase domain-containing protein [Mycolicibacterium xanthum]